MKKKLFIMFTCFMVVACNEQEQLENILTDRDNDSERIQLTQSQQESTKLNQDSIIRLNEVMDSVMSIAKELELSITLNRDYTAKHLDEVNIDSIKALFRGLATIKGRYMMNIEKQSDDAVIVKQYKRDKKKSRRIAGIKSESNGYVEFNTESVNNGGYSFSCDCELFWWRDNEGNVINPYSKGAITRKYYGGYWDEISNRVNTSNPDWIEFYGSIFVYSIDFGIEYSKTFTYTANYFPSAASLSYVSWF